MSKWYFFVSACMYRLFKYIYNFAKTFSTEKLPIPINIPINKVPSKFGDIQKKSNSLDGLDFLVKDWQFKSPFF